MSCPKSDLKEVVGQAESALFQALAASGDKRRTFLAWLAYCGISKTRLARHLGVDMSSIEKYWRRGQAPAERVEQLRKFGVPEFLLPAVSPRPPRGRCEGNYQERGRA